jgi:hypothetical protein
VSFAISAAVWAILFTSVPAQNFPLNDDWAFARSAFRFSRGEGIDYGGWASMPQLGQWLWACPFLWLMGDSHVALRLATLVLSWLGLWAFYDLLRGQDFTPAQAALASVTLAANPLFFLLQGTFMTDVPALALSLISLALYDRALRRKQLPLLAIACLTGMLAASSRQNTAVASLVAGILLWQRTDLRGRPVLWMAVLLPALVGVVTHIWFRGRPDIRPLQLGPLSPANLLLLPFLLIHFSGLSAMPLLIRDPWTDSWKRFLLFTVIMLLGAGYWLLWGAYLPYGGLFPYSENMLTPWGAFAGSKFTGLLAVGERPLLLDTTWRAVLSLLGCLAGAGMLARIFQPGLPQAGKQPLLWFTVFQIPFLVLVTDFYDRYLLFLIPGTLALAAVPAPAEVRSSKRKTFFGWGTALATMVVSLGLMHDWLAWNAARWELGRRAVASGINRLEIEGGVEWDGWHVASENRSGSSRQSHYPVLPFTREWFPAIKGRYALSFSELKGARRVDSEPYVLWLLPGPRQFYLLELPPIQEAPAAHSNR